MPKILSWGLSAPPPEFLSSSAFFRAFKVHSEPEAASDASTPGSTITISGDAIEPFTYTPDPGTPARTAALIAVASYARRRCGATVCAVVTKPSRSEELSSRNVMSADPTDGVCFLPLDPALDLPLNPELSVLMDIVLHKLTDFLEAKDGAVRPDSLTRRPAFDSLVLGSLGRAGGPSSRGVPLLEPPEALKPVLDRRDMMAALHAARSGIASPSWRPPVCAYVDGPCAAPASELERARVEAGLEFPLLVKARVACGPPESHHMALVFGEAGWEAVASSGHVPFPAVLQEYRDHGARQLKVYVLGSQVYAAAKASIPDLSWVRGALGGSPASPAPSQSLLFSSLKSLPITNEDLAGRLGITIPTAMAAEVSDAAERSRADAQASLDASQRPREGPGGTDEDEDGTGSSAPSASLVREIAGSIWRVTGLSIFGFDIVVPSESKEALVVDLNAFPSFRGFDEREAARALADLVKEKARQL